MNAFQKGVNLALGIDANIGTPDQLFFPANFKRGYAPEWFRRKLSTAQVATLMHVDQSTVRQWRIKGWLEGRYGVHRHGWQRFEYWRYSLQDLEDCLFRMRTRKRRGNPIEHKTWTPQEIEQVLNGETPEYRSPLACRVKRCRLRKGLKK